MTQASFLLEYTDAKAFVVYWDIMSKKYIHQTVTHIRQYLDANKAYAKSFKKTKLTLKAANNNIDGDMFRKAISYLYTHQDVFNEIEKLMLTMVDEKRRYTAVHRIIPYCKRGALYFKITIGKYSVYENSFEHIYEFDMNVNSLKVGSIPVMDILERMK